ncbi:MAG TPA: response regulator [Hellea balneolensis]|uniref:Response regulator n=1 Tax=Hellea balneolensis TaxID=287478 RepID=A0A7C5M091_9PROT|nr:response regulator [Hellea balneolensis]
MMLSSCDKHVSTADLQSIGITSYLVKPVRETQLHSELVKLVSGARQQKSVQNSALSPYGQPATQIRETLDARARTDHIILVAEDFALNQDVVRLMLEGTEYTPLFVGNGKEAVETFIAEPDKFSAILMDISMPVMDGYEAAEKIHEHLVYNNLPKVPIIALTGHALKHDREKCLESHMDDYLTKPVKQDELIGVLEHWISGQSILQQA